MRNSPVAQLLALPPELTAGPTFDQRAAHRIFVKTFETDVGRLALAIILRQTSALESLVPVDRPVDDGALQRCVGAREIGCWILHMLHNDGSDVAAPSRADLDYPRDEDNDDRR